jgi:hypothetical protein
VLNLPDDEIDISSWSGVPAAGWPSGYTERSGVARAFEVDASRETWAPPPARPTTARSSSDERSVSDLAPSLAERFLSPEALDVHRSLLGAKR